MPTTLSQIGKYRIERELGRGGMGVVYKGFDPIVERTVAIKTIRLDVENAEELVTRLKREAKSVGHLEHTNIVTLYDAGEAGGLFYLAMQFIKGETLQDRIDRQRWFPLKEICELFRQICAGLGYAHEHGVIHRDIKPANIMITNEGVVKLTDFGIAKLANTGMSTSGLIVGTPSYMSPEQALGKPLDGRSDIFSLGSILYELTTGEKAFPGQNVTTVIYKIVHEPPTPIAVLQPGLDPEVEALVSKALAKTPEQRFQTCSELSTALELYLSKAAAAMPRTFVPPEAATPPSAPAVSQGVPTPTPFPAVAPAPSPSTAIPMATAPGVTTGTQAAPSPARLPLAWLGAGVFGALLLVIIILLAVQLRRPGEVLAPSSTTTHAPATVPAAPPTGSQATGAQPGPSSTTANVPATVPSAPPTGSQATGAQPGSTPATVQRPAPTRRAPQPASGQAAKHVAVPQETQKPSRLGGTQAQDSQSKIDNRKSTISTPLPPEPETFDSLSLKGDLAFQQGKYQDALNAYSKAYKLNPYNRDARRKIAVTLTLLGRVDEAAKYQ